MVASVAQRYGKDGSFWTAHPELPYEPVEKFEIGNEENLPVYWVVDTSHLHWNAGHSGQSNGSAEYATVYRAARAALHRVDPSATAVVGGLADSARLGIDVQLDEAYLAALAPSAVSPVDAVGYHDWVYQSSTPQTIESNLKADTVDLRSWMDGHGYGSVPLDVNEFGACYTTSNAPNGGQCSPQISMTDAQWAPVAADYVKWAVCTPSLKIENIQPFYWGATPDTDSWLFLPLVSSNGSLTQFGTDYLNLVKTLTTTGCTNPPGDTAPVNTSAPSVNGTALDGHTLIASAGTWTGSPTLSYQWIRCDASVLDCSSVGGATATTYVLEPEDVGSRLEVSLRAVNSAGRAAANSAPTEVVETSAGVPPGGTSPPDGTNPLKGSRVSSMHLRLLRVVRHGRLVTVTVRRRAHSGAVTVTAVRRGRGKHLKRRFKGHRRNATTMTFTARLLLGRWAVTIAAKPAQGYSTPKPVRRTISV